MSVPRLLTASTVALVLTHWLRLLPLGYAAPGATRWEDFADLVTPYVVVGPLLVVLGRTAAGRRSWVVAVAAALLFVQGHGLHLSANSISYATGPQAPAELWDEQISHLLWFTGLAVLMVVVVEAVRPLRLRAGPAAAGLAGLVGTTWAANVIEGGVVALGVPLAVGLATYGWRTRYDGTGRLLLGAFGLSLVLIAAYGVWLRGYPQPSELGWL